MDKLSKNRIKGFTMIELMIVIIVVAILVALAYPSYTSYTRKAKRGDAQQMMMNWAINQEIWRSNHPQYNQVTDPTDPEYMLPSSDYFTFTPANVGATSYTIQAEGIGDQLKDEDYDSSAGAAQECGSVDHPLTLDHNGQKLPAACWK